MFCVSSQDLQKQVGDVQLRAAREPVLITAHGKPRCVLLSVDEYARLKDAAGEPVPSEARRKAVTYRAAPDPLGYDLSNMDAALRAMADDALSGRSKDAVESELAAVRRRLRRAES